MTVRTTIDDTPSKALFKNQRVRKNRKEAEADRRRSREERRGRTRDRRSSD